MNPTRISISAANLNIKSLKAGYWTMAKPVNTYAHIYEHIYMNIVSVAKAEMQALGLSWFSICVCNTGQSRPVYIYTLRCSAVQSWVDGRLSRSVIGKSRRRAPIIPWDNDSPAQLTINRSLWSTTNYVASQQPVSRDKISNIGTILLHPLSMPIIKHSWPLKWRTNEKDCVKLHF